MYFYFPQPKYSLLADIHLFRILENRYKLCQITTLGHLSTKAAEGDFFLLSV